MFKVGDSVRVVNAHGSVRMGKGDVRTVVNVDRQGRLTFAEHMGLYTADRFELIPNPVPMRPAEGVLVRLRVIEGMRPHLRVGDIVTVKKENEKSYLLNEHPGKLWAKRRFEIIEEVRADGELEKRAITKGDEVRLKKDCKGQYDCVRKGCTYIVREIRDKGFWFEGINGVYAYPFHDFELAQEVKKAPRPLKVGDRVVAVATKKSFKRFGPSEHMDVAVQKKAVMTVKAVDLQGVKGQIQMEILVGDGFHLNWYSCWDVSELIHEDGSPITDNVIKEEPKQPSPPKPVIGCIYEEAAKQEKAGVIGKDLCSWVVQNKGSSEYQHQNWPCYAGLQDGVHSKVEQCLISMKNAKRYIHTVKEQEMYDDWLQYVVEESPFKSAFLSKTAEEAKEKGLLLDCSRSRVECLTSATAMRDGYEHSSRLPIFTHFIEEGYSKHTAYLLSYMLTEHDGSWNMSAMYNGHTNMDGSQDIQQIFKFFREGFHNASWKAQPAWNSGKVGSRGMYIYIAEASKDSMRAFVQSFGKKSGDGWQERYSFDEACVKKLADEIEKNVTK